MIKGVGIDLMSMDRISRDMPLDDAFIRRAFTGKEREELASCDDPHEFICSRFSTKEAVFKSLGRDGDDFRMTDVEILEDPTGAPRVELCGVTAEMARSAGIFNVLVSISYDGNLVISVAVADGEA